MNKEVKTAPNGKTYETSNEFKVGDIVAIHNKITGEFAYAGVLQHYSCDARGHLGHILVSGGVQSNTLGTALVIESGLVNAAIYHFEQSTPEKMEEDFEFAYEHECQIFALFEKMNDNELNSYRLKLVELGYSLHSDYNRTANGLVTTKTFNK
jgi:hypothetical protein